jgi:hypothetical protein
MGNTNSMLYITNVETLKVTSFKKVDRGSGKNAEVLRIF